MFEISNSVRKTPLLAAVGPLQFDLVQYRLEAEYGAVSRIEKAPWTMARWVNGGLADNAKPSLPHGVELAHDRQGMDVVLFPGEWHMRYFSEQNKEIELMEYAS
jgi:peptide chain release factor 3